MGCGGDREKGAPPQTARWSYITLSDFKRTSAWTPVAYVWLWIMAFVGIAVYGVDTFTAVNLLVFDQWSSSIDPSIDFKYSKWIFAGCILLSWGLCIFEWMRALRIIKRGGVASSYMDPLAASLQSMRGQGWKRFLVFTELTKSKKGTDYIAFFVYFAFQGAIRIILAEGPRQVINALTLYAVMDAKILHGSEGSEDDSGIEKFWSNVQALADENLQQAIILSSMLFTLVIWVFSALCLLVAAILYLSFLWHYIPQEDGRLKAYCRRKVDRRLEKIVEHKIKAAIEEENRLKEQAERKAELKRQKTGELPPPAAPKIARKPTLPVLGESPELRQGEDSLPKMPLTRQDTNTTMSTLPVYSSRPPTRQGISRQPTLPDMQDRPNMPSRSGTQGSGWTQTSYSSDAPLMGNAGFAGGDGRTGSPAPNYATRQDSNGSFARPPPDRKMSQSTLHSQRSYTSMARINTSGSQRSFQSAQSRPPPGVAEPMRSNTGPSSEHEWQPTPIDAYAQPTFPAPSRQNTQDSFHRRESSQSSFTRPRYGSLHSHQSSFSRPGTISRKPTPQNDFNRPPQTQSPDSYEMTSQPSYGPPSSVPPPTAGSSGYVAFNPSVHSATPGPQRNITVAGAPGAAGDYFGSVQELPQRSVTAPAVDHRATTGYGDILDDYGDAPSSRRVSPGELPRAHTAGPLEQDGYGQGQGWQGRYRGALPT